MRFIDQLQGYIFGYYLQGESIVIFITRILILKNYVLLLKKIVNIFLKKLTIYYAYINCTSID